MTCPTIKLSSVLVLTLAFASVPASPQGLGRLGPWGTLSSIDPIDDSEMLQATLLATGGARLDPNGNFQRYSLIVACLRGELSVWIGWAGPTELGRETDVTVRLDTEAPKASRWDVVGGSEYVSSREPYDLLDQLRSAKRLAVRVTEGTGATPTAVFDLGPIEEIAAKVLATCKRHAGAPLR